MTLPKGYNKSSPTPKGKGSVIAGLIIVLVIIIAIGAFISWGLNEDDKEFNKFADAGCRPTTSSYTGAVSSWMCPPGVDP